MTLTFSSVVASLERPDHPSSSTLTDENVKVVHTLTTATECGFEILPHPLYSPDMAPSDFYLFPKQKSHLHGTQHGSNEGVIEAVNKYLEDQEKAFYFEGIRKLAKYIALKGDYIQKNWSNFHSLVD